MAQVIDHDLGYKIVDFDLGDKNKSEFFYYLCFKCVGYALEEQFLLCTTCTGKKK